MSLISLSRMRRKKRGTTWRKIRTQKERLIKQTIKMKMTTRRKMKKMKMKVHPTSLLAKEKEARLIKLPQKCKEEHETSFQ